MELLFYIFCVYIIIRLWHAGTSAPKSKTITKNTPIVENIPQRQNTLPYFGRITYKNLVLASDSGNTPHTEIDEVILSPYGIFCIEYKAHKGVIFGTAKNKTWTQCKYNDEKIRHHNPIHQNYKHTQAIEQLLGSLRKAPIHSFVVYTGATDIHVDSDDVFLGGALMEARIAKHTKQIYTLEEYQEIAKLFAIAGKSSKALLPIHIREVNDYLATLPA